jgi:hypothetical protein
MLSYHGIVLHGENNKRLAQDIGKICPLRKIIA